MKSSVESNKRYVAPSIEPVEILPQNIILLSGGAETGTGGDGTDEGFED